MARDTQNYARMLKKADASVFILGPRGTGKTEWVHSQYSKETLWINLLTEKAYLELSGNPDLLINWVEANPHYKYIVIDEVQRVPSVLNVVHHLIEKHKDRQFIMTASSARKLRQRGVNLLGGRALTLFMHPFMACELGQDFNLEHALQHGMVPLVWMSKTPEQQLTSYIHSYMQEEIETAGLGLGLGVFTRFLQAMSFSQGSPLNMSSIARECHVSLTSVKNYIALLDSLFMSFQINVFSKRAQRRLVAQPKFYYFDCGVFRTLRPMGKLDTEFELMGPLLEGLVGQHLRAWCSYSKGKHELFYWRTAGGTEVDFVIYGETELVAIEVKNASKIKPEHVRSLNSFGKDYPEAKRILLFRGEISQTIGDVLCLPVEQFLKKLIPNQPI